LVIELVLWPIDSLPTSELDTLTEIAQLTFGNYSNIIRNYLNMVYDKPIFWPVTESGLIPRSSLKDRPLKSKKAARNFVISPNPHVQPENLRIILIHFR